MKIRITRSIVPNLFTLVNLFMGFTAIVYIANDDYRTAVLCIFVAALFDMLDGVVARILRSASEFGVELDSLCDAVSFGIAPAYLSYKVFFYQYGEIGILFGALPALTGVVRLARFNVQVSGFEDKLYFTGLPIPGGALTLISFILFFYLTDIIHIEYKGISFFAVTLVTSLAMVSKIKFNNIPRPSKRAIKQNPVVFAIFLIGVILSIISKGYFIFPFMVFYIFASVIRYVYHRIKTIRQSSSELDDIEEDESISQD